MAVIPISTLSRSHALSGGEYILDVQNGTTYKTTVDDINLLNTLDTVTRSGNTTTNSIQVLNLSANDVFINGESINSTLIDLINNNGSVEVVKELRTDIQDLSSSIDNINVSTVEDITSNTYLGSISPADIIPSGTTLQELAELILCKVYVPTFILPSTSLTGNLPVNVEVGTIGLTLNANYNAGSINGKLIDGEWHENIKQADRAGSLIHYTFTGQSIATVTQVNNTLNLPSVLIEEGINTFTVNTSYSEGPQPIDSKGSHYNQPLIAGSVSATLNVYGRRNAFYGTDIVSIDNDGIRSLNGKKINPSNNTKLNILIPASSTDVAFAYPAVLDDVSSVVYVEGLNAEIKGIFTQQIIAVKGDNNYPSIDYKLYTYSPAAPYESDTTYIVTI